MTERDALVAQRDLQLERLLEAHKALVRRFEQADAERIAQAAVLADAEALLALAEQEIALRDVHARGVLRALDGLNLDVQEWRQRAEDAEAQVSAGIVQAQAQAAAFADADRRAAQLRDDLAQAQRRIERLHDELDESHEDIRRITGSRSWKLTQPLRRLGALFRRTTDPT